MDTQLIRIPGPLFLQLKELTVVRNSSIVDLIRPIAADAIMAGEIPDVTPGYEITSIGQGDGRKIVMNLEGRSLPALTLDDARALAGSLQEIAERKHVRHLVMIPEGGIAVFRSGQGVTIDFNHSTKTSVSLHVALDLARQLRAAAA